jgi:protein SCO1
VKRPSLHVVAPAAICVALGALGGVGTALVTEPDPAPELVRFTVPDRPAPTFRLRDETGAWRTPASARGDVLIVTFIYTRCRDLCPRQAAEIKDAVLAADGGVQVYAISVDPEHDDRAAAQAWLERMGVAGGPVHILLGSRRELEPVWDRYGIVPIATSPRAEEDAEHDDEAHGKEDPHESRAEKLEGREPPAAALDPYPAVGDGTYRGRPRHAGGLDFEHSAYALLIDARGRQRVGFPYELIRSDLLLADVRALKREG